MFKKECSNCNKKIEKSHSFCPYCGTNLNPNTKEDYGFLGKDDFEDNFNPMNTNLPINKLFKTAMKMTEKMMKDMQNQETNRPKEHYKNNMDIQFFVNGKKVFPEKQIKMQKPEKIETRTISKEKANEFAKLPRKEPKTKMKRLSGKLLYELSVPGVSDINDVFINQLENSIEIKALSKTKVYSKTLEVNLPIIGYKLDKDNLILELQAK
tara:strand:- start:87 stop:716 length:630 start_codon:yes stop_codon:yes gene_type:complete